MRELLDKFDSYVARQNLLVRFAIACGCIFVAIMWCLLVITNGIWFFIILADALLHGVSVLLWLIPWSLITAILITLFLAVLSTGLFD